MAVTDLELANDIDFNFINEEYHESLEDLISFVDEELARSQENFNEERVSGEEDNTERCKIEKEKQDGKQGQNSKREEKMGEKKEQGQKRKREDDEGKEEEVASTTEVFMLSLMNFDNLTGKDIRTNPELKRFYFELLRKVKFI